jgi:hypothetical protein
MTQVMEADAGQASPSKQREEASLPQIVRSSGPPTVLGRTKPCSSQLSLLLFALRGLATAMVDQRRVLIG